MIRVHGFSQNKLFLVTIIYAVSILLARILLLEFSGHGINSGTHFISILAGICNELLIGIILFYILLKTGHLLISHLFFLLIVLFIAFCFACFHYEAVFGVLPGADILYYLREVKHLAPSLDIHLSFPALFAETLAVSIILYLFIFCIELPDHIFRRKINGLLGILIVVGIGGSLFLQGYTLKIPEKYFWGTRQPAIWMIQSLFIKETYNIDKLALDTDDFREFLYLHGQYRPVPTADTRYPLCGRIVEVNKSPGSRNIILVILEGVGNREMNLEILGKELMPNLKRIAGENLYFKSFQATGTKSVQALPAIFSGLPAQPFYNYLWKTPFPEFKGFPEKLGNNGYKTVFFHGGDLSFERQRQYLQTVGFDEIVEYTPDLPYRMYGWGYDDGVMFSQLKNWIQEKQNNDPDTPYLASLFTLSTHDPYVLPEDWESVFSSNLKSIVTDIENNSNTVIVEDSYAFLDYHLGKFYDWFRDNAENTLLIITSDHAPHIVNDGDGSNTDDIRFDLPLIVAGLSDNDLERYQNYTGRIGTLHDLPATILGLTDRSPHLCNLGQDLLVDDDKWPEQRFIYSVAGDAMQRIILKTDQSGTVIYDRIRKRFNWIHNGVEKQIPPGIKRTFENLMSVHYYLLEKNAYFPNRDFEPGESIAATALPLIISHRGNTNGPGNSAGENRREAIENAIEAGFEWVEIDVQLTGDGTPVLIHDSHINVNDSSVAIRDISLVELQEINGYRDVLTLKEAIEEFSGRINLLIEVKPQSDAHRQIQVARTVSNVVRKNNSGGRIIVDSFHEIMARSIKQHCDCETGFDTPFRKGLDEADIVHVKKMNMDWIYVHFSQVTGTLINTAHKYGLRVMAYTVNSDDVIDQWFSNVLPDGIITDDSRIRKKLISLYYRGQQSEKE